ncbi:H-NS family nucleoid-associated regulatory protein [Sagittula sp. S175]|uniref:H-NS histone family protein n=1 Tax=Sagittula sp. S175 TaxID=3415129 RepID=UPI003C7D3C3E
MATRKAASTICCRGTSSCQAKLTVPSSDRLQSSRTPAAAKYRNPENPALTWSGRGRKPLWFVEELEEGKTASDLAIS